MAKKKYVPAGVFLTCDKGTVPNTLQVTFNARTSIYGQNLATDLDKVPNVNVPPLGICSITKAPCQVIPVAWNPVKTDVQLGKARLLLEDSKLQCGLGGRISINFSLAAAQAACPPPPAPKSVFDQADDYLKSLGPAGDMARFQLGVAEGVWEGGKGLAEGLWGMAKGGWNAVTHPVDTAKAIQEGATSAYKWAGDSQNWSNAASSAGQGISNAAAWAGNGENWQKVGQQMQQMSPRDWGKIGGQVAFEVGLTVGTAGAGAALNAAAKTSRVARMASRVARVADVEGLALKAAGKVARSAAGKMKVVGKVLTGAKKAKRTEKAVAAGRKARKLRAVEGCAGPKKCTKRGHPVDVATGLVFAEAVDFELPGPIPFSWSRTWYSRSTHAGVLGHGWHHGYDLALTVEEDHTVAVRMADGRLALFQSPVGEQGSYNRSEKLELFHDPVLGYRIWHVAERLWYKFEPVPGADSHRLVAVEDANGFTIRFTYTEQEGHLHSITDSAGRVLRAEMNEQGCLMALHAPLPEPGATGTFPIVRYEYSPMGDLVAVVDALGHATRFEYTDHLLMRETNRTGLSFYFTYNGTGPAARCLRTWGDEGIHDTKFRYDSEEQTTVWDSLGHTTIYNHQNGLVTTMVDALGATWHWDYNDYQELLFRRNPLNQAASYEYDEWGQVTQLTRPDGTRIQSSCNDQGLPVQAKDANGNTWQWQYDVLGNLLSITDPLGTSTQYVYNQGLLAQIVDSTGVITSIAYDKCYQPARITTADGQVSSRAYDSLGRVVTLTDTQGSVQRRRYDLLGRLISLGEPNGIERQLRYDGEGNLLWVQEGDQQISFEYTGLSRVTSRLQNGRKISFDYDLEGRLTGLRNEHGQQYHLGLDAVGNTVIEIGFDGVTRQYLRDLVGRVVEVSRPGQRFTRYAYDSCGRVTGVRYHDGTTESFHYRADGQLLGASNEHAVVLLEKDPLGRLLAEAQENYLIKSVYDTLGQRAGIASSLGAKVKIDRAWNGLITNVQTDNWQAQFDYDQAGSEIQRTSSGKVQASWYRDVFGQPTQQRLLIDGRLTLSRRYNWHTSKKLITLEDNAHGTTQYTYDAWGNLTAARYANGDIEYRQPDTVGNVYRSKARTDRYYGKGGQLLQANGTTYEYDEEGNLVAKRQADGSKWNYVWTANGMLSRVVRPDGSVISFTYDALGRRLSKCYKGQITRWVWDGDKPLHEWIEREVGCYKAEEIITWLFEENSFAPLAKITKNQSYSVVTDYLGTPLRLVDQQGHLVWEATLDTYGFLRQGQGDRLACPFRYPGQYEDAETGLYYNRFRYYDPELGSYISQDPIGLHGVSLNLYSYVSNTTNNVDILGLYPLWDPKSLRWRDSVTGRFRGRPTELVKTKSGEAFFWSGRTPKPDGSFGGGASAAEAIARAEHGTTLEMLIEHHEIKMPTWDDKNPIHTREWGKISEAYAQGASGRVRGVIGQSLRDGNIWEGYERGALMSNPNVTEIVTIDPVTGERKTIHKKGC